MCLELTTTRHTVFCSGGTAVRFYARISDVVMYQMVAFVACFLGHMWYAVFVIKGEIGG